MSKERKVGLDIIRTIAILTVMLTHMFGFHMELVDSDLRTAPWTFYVLLKFTATLGVPLFLLLTGYLQSKREWGRKHYLSIIPVLLSYAVICVINTVAENALFNPEFNLFRHIVSILDFEYGYGWYVEMYIGLFLLIPFLNIMFKNLSKPQKLWLIASLAFLSFLPSALQYISVGGAGFEILPDFFKNLYVLAYYFIGAYIAEYKPKPNKLLCFAVLLAVLLFETGLCYYGSTVEYAWWFFNNVASVTHAVVATCVFLIFYDVRGNALLKPFSLVAASSFEMYLLSYITDKICYEYIAAPVGVVLFADFVLVFIVASLLRLLLVPVGSLLKQPIVKKKEETVAK